MRCVPPQNKPDAGEIATCRPFLAAEIAGMPRLRAILALGAIAHQSVLAALGLRRGPFPFRHGALHDLPAGLALADSYHCSRLNTNTGTPDDRRCSKRCSQRSSSEPSGRFDAISSRYAVAQDAGAAALPVAVAFGLPLVGLALAAARGRARPWRGRAR